MDGFKLPAGDPKRSASNLMFYTAIVGKSPTIEGPSAPPAAPRGSLRWFTSHCRTAGTMMGGSLRTALGMSTWLAKECRAARVVAERSFHAGVKRLSRAN